MILQTLNKISGAVVGFVVYPIKSAVINMALFVGTIIFATIFIFVAPIAIAVEVYNENHMNTLVKAILIGIGLGLMIFVLGIPAVLMLLIVEIGLAIKDLVRSSWIGITEGYKEGLFFNFLTQNLFDFSRFSTALKMFKYFLLDESDEQPNYLPQMDETGFDALFEKSEQGTEFSPLSQEELELARGKNTLTDILERYIDLNDRLTKLDEAIQRRANKAEKLLAEDDVEEGSEEEITTVASVLYDEKNESLDDELVVYSEIRTPILIVKKFEASPGQWKTVPGTTHFSDRATLKKWVVNNNSHPQTREPLDGADPYRDKKAKYVLREYSGKKDAQELVEAAKLIRQEIGSREVSLTAAGRAVSHFSEQIKQMFFGAAKPDNTDELEEQLEHTENIEVQSRRLE